MTERYDFFRRCFPDVIRNEETARELLARPECREITHTADGQVVGRAALLGGCVILLGVLPEYRNRGVGSELLEKAEKLLAAEGYDECAFCDGDGYLTPGVPLYEGNREFFEKRGYFHDWGDCECVDMSMELADYVPGEIEIGGSRNGFTYRWAREDEIGAVCGCVEDAHSEFVKYYRSPEKYRADTGGERVLIAVEDASGTVCGALLVGAETESPGVGSVGCTATRHAYRNRGVASTLVRLGTGSFRDKGIPKAFLGYTYTDVIPLYARSGYRVCRKYMMAKKKLTKTVLDVPFLDQRKDYPTGCESVSASMLLWANGFDATVDEFIDNCLPIVSEPRQEGESGEWIGPDPRKVYPGNPRTDDGWGCFAPAVKTALERWFTLHGEAWEAEALYGLSLTELCARYVDRGQPVVVFATMGMEPPHEYRTWRIEGTDETYTWMQPMHCLLLTGHDREHFYFNDPLCAKNQPYPMKAADFAHRGMGEMAVVIRPIVPGEAER